MNGTGHKPSELTHDKSAPYELFNQCKNIVKRAETRSQIHPTTLAVFEFFRAGQYEMALNHSYVPGFNHRELQLALGDSDWRNKGGVDLARMCLEGTVTEAMLDLFLRAGVNLEARDETWGAPPLHLAAASGLLDVVEKLLDAGAEWRALNRYGVTALGATCVNGFLDVARVLVDRCPPRNTEKDADLTHALARAVAGGRLQVR